MANEKGSTTTTAGLQWKITLPEGSSVKLQEEGSLSAWGTWWTSGLAQAVLCVKDKLLGFFHRAWKLGVNDPRKVIHGLKVGLALSLVSLFYYTRKLYDGVGGTAMWAIMTVVVVSEFTVGGTLYKGINRMMATFSAGLLAIGVHYVAEKSGSNTIEPIILGTFLFLLGSAATFSKFIPEVKAKFDYGITIFILTLTLVTVSGYRVEALLAMAIQRLLTISIGCFICFLVSMLVHPIWAGIELHKLIISNMEKLAMSLEGYSSTYFATTGDTKPCSTAQVYKCILNSKAMEESLANFARWEPAHGKFGFRHPWKQYLQVAAALRSSGCCMETLHASLVSNKFVEKSIYNQLTMPCMELSSSTSKVIREMSKSIKLMAKSSDIDVLLSEMNHSAEALENAMRSFPLQSRLSREKAPSASVTGLLAFATFVSVLIEVSSRVQVIAGTVNALADIARFSDAKSTHIEPSNDVMVVIEKDRV